LSGVAVEIALRHCGAMEVAPVAVATLLVAIAGPLGITLGWWLGRRGEHERVQREERKAAYVAFVHASIRFRNATDDERRSIRDERWAAFAEIVLVAPPAIVKAASHQVATGERLLGAPVGTDERAAVFRELWDRNRAFTALARADLKVGATDAFEGLQPILGERLGFDTTSDTPS
jgi:hypothetical protein